MLLLSQSLISDSTSQLGCWCSVGESRMKAPSSWVSGLGWTRNASISSQRSGVLWLLVPLLWGWVCFSVYDSFGYQHVRMLQFGLLDG